MSDGEKLSKVDSADTDVEKDEKGPVKDIKEVRNNAPPSRKFDFDTGEEHVRFRRHWWQIW